MTKKYKREKVFVTGANGEVGHGLIPILYKRGYKIIAYDINRLDDFLKPYVYKAVLGNILDKKLIVKLMRKQKPDIIFHLAAILSTKGEKDPEKAHLVNVDGTALLLEIANKLAQKEKRPIKFLFPSSIAIYGIPSLKIKNTLDPIKEEQYNNPITMYGINKLYCEFLGKYYSTNYKLLTKNSQRFIDFRSLRFPGIISAQTIPSGGTSDYASEMIHFAAKGKEYKCFVREDTKIPFMAMPDAVKALVQLAEARRENLTQKVYNVSAFSVTAKDIFKIVKRAFPNSRIIFVPDQERQKIVDSWPAEINDSRARHDWNWQPEYDVDRAFSKYLIPEIRKKYSKTT